LIVCDDVKWSAKLEQACNDIEEVVVMKQG
jgi:hypothetical protein